MERLNHESIRKAGRYTGLSIDGLDREVVQGLHRFMVRLRRCEEAIIEEYHPADEMRCPVHFCIGQEAASAALSMLLKDDDYLFSHHRSHGYFLAKRAPMSALLAELYGRVAGANGGIAGSQDLSMPSINFHAGGILAGALAISVGSALGIQLKGDAKVSVAGFGEAVAEEGLFWEAINYSALRELPVVFVCENNIYATYSHRDKRQSSTNISERVAAFGVETHPIFGNDVASVYSTIKNVVDKARETRRGPFFIETFTYRWNGHVGPEDDDYVGYRPAEELEFWKDNCPIALLEEQMVPNGLLSPSIKTAMLKEIDAEIANAFEIAKSSPHPVAPDWQSLNYSTATPLADKLLKEFKPAGSPEQQTV